MPRRRAPQPWEQDLAQRALTGPAATTRAHAGRAQVDAALRHKPDPAPPADTGRWTNTSAWIRACPTCYSPVDPGTTCTRCTRSTP
jgi:hypothetical protein